MAQLKWNPLDDFASVVPLDPDTGVLPSYIEQMDRYAAWRVFEQVAGDPGFAQRLACPVLHVTVAELEGQDWRSDWPFLCTYSSMYRDDEDGRRLEIDLGMIQPSASTTPSGREMLLFGEPRAISTLFPQALLAAGLERVNHDLVDLALANGAEFTTVMPKGHTGSWVTTRQSMLEFAIYGGDGGLVRRALAAGADPSFLDYANGILATIIWSEPAVSDALNDYGFPRANDSAGARADVEGDLSALADHEFVPARRISDDLDLIDIPPLAGPLVVDIWVCPAGAVRLVRSVSGSGNSDDDLAIMNRMVADYRFTAARKRYDMAIPVMVRETVRWGTHPATPSPAPKVILSGWSHGYSIKSP